MEYSNSQLSWLESQDSRVQNGRNEDSCDGRGNSDVVVRGRLFLSESRLQAAEWK